MFVSSRNYCRAAADHGETWSDETDKDVMTMHELVGDLALTAAETVSTAVDLAELAR